MSEQQGYIVPGVPEGYEVIEFRHARYDDIFLGTDGKAHTWKDKTRESSCGSPILRKIEKPKQYRPFTSAEEFKPHRDRWWRWKTTYSSQYICTHSFDDFGHESRSWENSFESKEFDDGTPFGVEVTE